MLDLFSGTGGASKAMVERSWHVLTVDNDPRACADLMMDVREYTLIGDWDLIWASPPCDEFSRERMPWSRTGIEPETVLVEAAFKIITDNKPKYWIIENTKGGINYITKVVGHSYRAAYGPYFLWGHFPELGNIKIETKKITISGENKRRRASIPYKLSLAVCLAVERQELLF